MPMLPSWPSVIQSVTPCSFGSYIYNFISTSSSAANVIKTLLSSTNTS